MILRNVVAAFVLLTPLASLAADAPAPVRELVTDDGVKFVLLGEKPPKPAPTLFVFAHVGVDTLSQEAYAKVGWLLAQQGWLCVSLDMPCHGADARAEEAPQLDGWAQRVAAGESPVDGLVKRGRAVLDFLIHEKYADPDRIAACGTSRGGFMALHFAASEPRVKGVAAFAPVTELSALREFSALACDERVANLDLSRVADKLADRAIWLAIGNHDERVGTDRAIGFTRKAVAAAVAKNIPARIELHVGISKGHSLHSTAHDEAAAWFALQEFAEPATK